MAKRYRLIGPDGHVFESAVPGTLGGTTAGLYGRLDCPSALRALAPAERPLRKPPGVLRRCGERGVSWV